MYSCAVLTEHVSDVFELEMNFEFDNVLLMEVVDYFLILVFEKPNRLSIMAGHQYCMFQINFVDGLKVLLML